MALFDFFKKKQKDKIDLDNLESYISAKEKENQSKEQEIIDEINNFLMEFINGLKEKNTSLKNINLNEKKGDPRINFVAKENLNKFIFHLDNFIKQLSELKYIDLDDSIKKVDYLFLDFEKKSRLNFEKATFLIGKELGEVRDIVNDFVKNLRRTVQENQSFFNSVKSLNLVKTKLRELAEIKKLIEEKEKSEEENFSRIKELEKKIFLVNLEIGKLKSSDLYKKELERELEIKLKKEELQKYLYELKGMIDFKKLADLFHYDSKKMTIINEYRLNFLNAFQKDRLLLLIPILNESNLGTSFINKKTNDVIQKEKEIEKMRKEINKSSSNEISELNKKIFEYNSEIGYLKEENEKIQKKKEKTIQRKSEIIEEIRQELKKIGAQLN